LPIFEPSTATIPKSDRAAVQAPPISPGLPLTGGGMTAKSRPGAPEPAVATTPQQLAAAFQQKLSVGPREFHQDFRPLPIAVISDRWIDGDAVFELESRVLDHGTKKRVQLVCCLNFVHRKKL